MPTFTTISTTIITKANNSMQKNKNLANSIEDNNRDIDVSMLIMLKNTVNFDKDENSYALSKSNHKNSNKSSKEVISYVTPSFSILNNNERTMSKTETTPTTTISNTIKSSLLEILLKELFKNKENNNNEYFLLDKTTPLDLIKSSFTTPKALASAKNLYNIKKNGELSAIFNTIISSDDALINNNKYNNYDGKRGENAYSIIDVSERILYSTPSVAPKTSFIITTTIIPTTIIVDSNISGDVGLIIIDDSGSSATDFIITTIAADAKNSTNEISTTSAAIVTLTTPNTVINISASAQLKNNDRYEIPLTIQFAPNYKIGKIREISICVEFRWEIFFFLLLYLFSREFYLDLTSQ